MTVSHNHAVVGQSNAAVQQHVAVTQVNHKTIALLFQISVAMISHTSVGRKFDNGRRPFIIQHHLIIASLGSLVPVPEMMLVYLTHFGAKPKLTHLKKIQRHQQHIAVVGAARAAEVGVAKAEDGVVTVVVATAAVPTLEACVGRRLNLAERHNGPREGVAVAVGTHHRVDIGGQGLVAAGGKQQHRSNNKDNSSHIILDFLNI